VLERYAYRDAGWPEDYDLVLRLLAGGQALGVVPRRLLCWRDAQSRLSRTSDTYSLQRFTACKAHFLAHGFLQKSPSYILWGYGDTGRQLARALAQHGKHPATIVEVHPGRIGQVILGAPVVRPADLPALLARQHLPIVVSVAHAGPRRAVRAALAELRCVERTDYVCAA